MALAGQALPGPMPTMELSKQPRSNQERWCEGRGWAGRTPAARPPHPSPQVIGPSWPLRTGTAHIHVVQGLWSPLPDWVAVSQDIALASNRGKQAQPRRQLTADQPAIPLSVLGMCCSRLPYMTQSQPCGNCGHTASPQLKINMNSTVSSQSVFWHSFFFGSDFYSLDLQNNSTEFPYAPAPSFPCY